MLGQVDELVYSCLNTHQKKFSVFSATMEICKVEGKSEIFSI